MWSLINYTAQGMWSAASGEGVLGAIAAVTYWKNKEYTHPPSGGVIEWTIRGVQAYPYHTFPEY